MVVGRDGSALVAWDAATGTEQWRAEMGVGAAWVEPTLVIATELVPFDRSSHAVHAYGLDTGGPQWTIHSPRPVVSVIDHPVNLTLVQTGDGPGCSD
jgi:outer membrane protein assembly factor BamB